MTSNTEILISLLTYNSKNHINECLKSLENQTNKNFKCFIFDNQSHDEIESEVKNYKNVTFVQTGANLGYTGGHNFALRYFQEKFPNHRYMMILNPDTILSENLIDGFQKIFTEDYFLYSCLIKDNFHDNKLNIGKNIHLPSFTFMSSELPTEAFGNKFIYTPFLSGCCFVVDYKKISKEELFRDYFMYHDEIELSIRSRMKGFKIPTVTQGFVKHSIRGEESIISDKLIYLLEYNRLRLQSDLFNDTIILLILPFYLISRILILLLYKPRYMYKPYLNGIYQGLKYWFINFGKEKKSMAETLKFLLIDNYFHKY